MRSGKMEFETLAKILLLTAFLIIVLLLFKGCMDAYNQLGGVGVKEYTCWATNVMKENVVSIWPSTCRSIIVKDQADTQKLGNLMGTCWWEYGQGQWDLGGKIDESLLSMISPMDIIKECYAVTIKEDIRVDDLKLYMETHNVKGEKVTKPKDTMWNYLQVMSTGDNVCFDKEDKGILKKGEIYYIKFLDNRAWIGSGKSDLLTISSDQKFFNWYPPKTAAKLYNWIVTEFTDPCYKYGTAATGNTGETSFRKAEEFTEKVNTCAKLNTDKECYCDNIDFTQLPANTYAYMREGSEKSSSIQLIEVLPPGTFTLIKGAVLQSTCTGTKPSCTQIMFIGTGGNSAAIGDTYISVASGITDSSNVKYKIDTCCRLQGTWSMVLKKENNIKKIILTQGTAPREKCSA